MKDLMNNIKPEDIVKLWGNMKYEDVKEFDSFIKSIPSGKDAQQATTTERTLRKKAIADKNALIERLRGYFDETSREKLLERRSLETDHRMKELNAVPYPIYIG